MVFKGVKCKNLNHLTQKCLHLSTNAPKSIVQLSIGERNQKLKRDGGADRKLDKLCYQAKMLPIFPRAAAS